MTLAEYVDADNTNPLIAVGKIVLWFLQKCIALWSDSAFVRVTGISLLSIMLAFFAMWVIVNIFVIRPVGVPVMDVIVEEKHRTQRRSALKAKQEAQVAREKARERQAYRRASSAKAKSAESAKKES